MLCPENEKLFSAKKKRVVKTFEKRRKHIAVLSFPQFLNSLSVVCCSHITFENGDLEIAHLPPSPSGRGAPCRAAPAGGRTAQNGPVSPGGPPGSVCDACCPTLSVPFTHTLSLNSPVYYVSIFLHSYEGFFFFFTIVIKYALIEHLPFVSAQFRGVKHIRVAAATVPATRLQDFFILPNWSPVPIKHSLLPPPCPSPSPRHHLLSAPRG